MPEKRNNIKVLHCMYAEKFIQPYIDFISDKFNSENHYFLIRKDDKYQIKKNKNILMLKNGESKFARIKIYYNLFDKSEKIILHGILSKEMWFILFFRPSALRKCYWIIWGGDLYGYLHRRTGIKHYIFEMLMKSVISRIGFLLTFLEDDFKLARDRYGATGKYIECLMYPSIMLEKKTFKKEYSGKTINILLGNSAFHTNNHRDLIDKLTTYNSKKIKIYCPLSYGPRKYAEEIEIYGKSIFNDKFIAIKKILPLDQYLSFLEKIDIALFDHKRQQALGNTISLIQRGAKVYMDDKTSQFNLFKGLNIAVFSNKKFNLSRLSSQLRNKNKVNVEKFFSIDRLTLQWGKIFNG
jgi:hypothetical protein